MLGRAARVRARVACGTTDHVARRHCVRAVGIIGGRDRARARGRRAGASRRSRTRTRAGRRPWGRARARVVHGEVPVRAREADVVRVRLHVRRARRGSAACSWSSRRCSRTSCRGFLAARTRGADAHVGRARLGFPCCPPTPCAGSRRRQRRRARARARGWRSGASRGSRARTRAGRRPWGRAPARVVHVEVPVREGAADVVRMRPRGRRALRCTRLLGGDAALLAGVVRVLCRGMEMGRGPARGERAARLPASAARVVCSWDA